jgi:hypothetical protein
MRGRVLELLRECGPLTDEEMQVRLEMNPSTQRPRRIELVGMGLVVDSGTTRKTRSGRSAVAWKMVSPPASLPSVEPIPGLF